VGVRRLLGRGLENIVLMEYAEKIIQDDELVKKSYWNLWVGTEGKYIEYRCFF
jgi:hypothetical protein